MRLTSAIAATLLAALATGANAAYVTFFHTDFAGATPPQLSGGDHLAGQALHLNPAAEPPTLSLADLPPHSAVRVSFTLAGADDADVLVFIDGQPHLAAPVASDDPNATPRVVIDVLHHGQSVIISFAGDASADMVVDDLKVELRQSLSSNTRGHGGSALGHLTSDGPDTFTTAGDILHAGHNPVAPTPSFSSAAGGGGGRRSSPPADPPADDPAETLVSEPTEPASVPEPAAASILLATLPALLRRRR